MSTWRPIRRLPRCLRWIPDPVLSWIALLAWLGCGVAAMASAVAFLYFLLSARYDLDEVAKLPSGTIYYDRDHQVMEDSSRQGRQLVKREDIPDFLVHALLSREDARFFSHHGVDLRGLARAILRNLKDRDFTQGASTLSMQLARNTFEIREKSIHRKLLEIAITLRIEARYSKEEILTHYLNRIYFGSGADGIAQAARTYFGKATGNLQPEESALLVGIIRGPHIFSPLRNPQKAVDQRNQTLERMGDAGYLTRAQIDLLREKPLILTDEPSRQRQASYALQAIQRELESVLDSKNIEAGGLHVHTTIASSWQKRLKTDLEQTLRRLEHEKSWKHPLPELHAPNQETQYLQYAAVTTETQTGAILALIGGRDFAHSRLDRTFIRRDLGSAAEPFIAAAASERGKLVLPGRPIQTGRQIGAKEVCRISRRCGISGPFAEGEDVFRGAISTSPRELSTALATIANDGKRPRPFLIREVRDSQGRILYRNKKSYSPAISPQAARDATTLLKRHGGTRGLTGATASEREAWALRLGPSGSTAIWLGFDQPAAIAPESRLHSLLEEVIQRLGNEDR